MNIVLCSGGLDSVVLAYMLHAQGEVELLTIDYGQRHKREVAHAQAAARRLGVQHHVVTLRGYGGGALSGKSAVPHAHYADPVQRATIVPARNLVLGAILAGVAAERGAGGAYIGIQGAAGSLYPDCRPEFIDALQKVVAAATEDKVRLVAPLGRMTKRDIIWLGSALDVPLDETWSCFEGRAFHCGSCGACVKRREGFKEAGMRDPTIYQPDVDMATLRGRLRIWP